MTGAEDAESTKFCTFGETCRQLNERFGEHKRKVEHKLHEGEKKNKYHSITVK